MQRLRTDLRHAFRQMSRAPGVTAAAVTVLALGIGASTAIFSVVDHILFRPLEYPGADRLVTLCETHPAQPNQCTVSVTNLSDWGDRSRTLVSVGAARIEGVLVGEGGRARGSLAALVTPGLFPSIGFPPALGRPIGARDLPPAGDGRVAVVTDEFWRSELGADPAVLGRTLLLDDEPYRLIGVMPPEFAIPGYEDWAPRILMPVPFDPRAAENRDWRGFRGYGRLAAVVSAQEADTELDGIQRDLAEDFPDALRGWGASVTPTREALTRQARPLLLLFLGAVVVTLLIVCVNLASLLLARAMTREREFAVRTALGARAGTLVRQLLVEAGVLTLIGGVAGVLFAVWATSAFVALAPSGIPRIDEVGVDTRILGFALLITVISAVIGGVVPSSRVRAFELTESLKDSRGGTAAPRTARLRRGLVVTEVALALMLVLSAGLLLRGFATLMRWDPGFQVEGLLTFQIAPYQATEDRARLAAIYVEAERRILAVPGVRAVGTVSAGPLFGGGDGLTPFLVQGRPPVPVQDAPRVAWYDAGPGYFATLGLPILEGRALRESDRGGSVPTAVVNESMARRNWPDASPVGARLTLPQWETEVEVVGVVADIRPFALDDPVGPAIYVSNRQYPRGISFVAVRTRGDPAAVAESIAGTLAELHPRLAPTDMMTLRDRLSRRLVRPRFNLVLVGVLALVALVLAATGVYGVIAYAVAQRTREFGIRMAIGAGRPDILRSVLIDALRLSAAGLVFGLCGAYFFTRLLQGVLVGVQPTDPLALVGTLALLAIVTAVATAIPALRASHTDPARALRTE